MTSARSITKIEDLECYLVGGAVRDRFLEGTEKSDRDWVVVGASPEIMLSLGFKEIGKDFPVFLHPRTHEEYALARTERKSGKGYKGFVVDVSADVTLEQDLHRRDLTINAMAIADDGRLIDPYGGRSDLENGLLRHVSDHFVEDPLRVLRVARFAARFFSKGFIVDDSTMNVMKTISASGELDDLTAERVWQEVYRALSESNPSAFFKTLRCCGALEKLFPELNRLYDVSSQDRASFVMDGLDRAASLSNCIDYRFAVVAYYINQFEDDESEDDSSGVEIVRQFCNRLKVPSALKSLSLQIARHAEQARRVSELSAEEIVNLIRTLNGVRNLHQFEEFLSACEIVLKTGSDNSQHVEQAIKLLKQCRDRMTTVDAKALSMNYSGERLGEEVRKEQIASVNDYLLEQPIDEQ